MKFNEIKKLLGNKYNIEDIKKAINSIAPTDIKRRLKGKNKDENLIIKIIKSKLV
jgi:hypothetical protein